MEEDLNTLQKKYSNLENEYDKANEGLIEANTKLEASEKRLSEVGTFISHPLRVYELSQMRTFQFMCFVLWPTEGDVLLPFKSLPLKELSLTVFEQIFFTIHCAQPTRHSTFKIYIIN